MRRIPALCCLLLALALGLSACGRKGPLYLPQDEPGEAAAAQAGERDDERN